jgi:hypothetical protein
MKKNIVFAILALVLLIVLLVAAPAMAKAVKTSFSGEESMAGPPLDPGTATFPGGNFHMRGLTAVYNDVTDDPRVTGQNTIVANWNFRPAPPPVIWTGPMWGTLHIENNGGAWDGTWTGMRDQNGNSIIKGVAHGSDQYAGMKGHWTFTRLTPDPTAPFDISGWILDPPG